MLWIVKHSQNFCSWPGLMTKEALFLTGFGLWENPVKGRRGTKESTKKSNNKCLINLVTTITERQPPRIYHSAQGQENSPPPEGNGAGAGTGTGTGSGTGTGDCSHLPLAATTPSGFACHPSKGGEWDRVRDREIPLHWEGIWCHPLISIIDTLLLGIEDAFQ